MHFFLTTIYHQSHWIFAPNDVEQLRSTQKHRALHRPASFVYDQAFRGSFSLKAVAPAILGSSFSYDGMLVSDVTAAQRTFEEMISPETSPNRKEELRLASLDYCKKDTLVMVELVKWLYEVSRA